MTASDQRMRPPDNPPPGPEWKPIPGAPGYEASHRGKVRSFKQSPEGKELGMRLQNRTNEKDTVYLLVDVRRADRSKWTGTVQSFVLLAHVGPPPPGMEICHGDGGPLDNRYPENISYNTKAFNEGMKERPPPPEPKPPVLCVNGDGREAVRGGRRCQECREEIGRAAAPMFADGADPEQVAKALNYGSANGVYRLAVDYGGLRLFIDEECIPATATGTRSPGRAPHPAISPVVIDDEVNATARAIRHAAPPLRWWNAIKKRLTDGS